MRIGADSEAVATHAPPMDKELKRRLAAIAKLSPGILLEDKGYSLALHYRLAPHAEKAIYEAVSLIRADLPNAPIEVLPGKCVCEIKHSGFNKATGVIELLTHAPFKGRRPIFIGDDVTDEAVFAIMPDLGGLAFSVGRRAHGVAGHFDEPRDVREWLARLVDDQAAAKR
jgi:trehalose 6-phosphate phosphatase